MKIGNKDIVFNEIMLIPDNEEANFTVQYNEDTSSPMKIIFVPEGDETRVDWEHNDGVVTFTFSNWNRTTDTAVTEPLDIGSFKDGRSILIYAYHNKIANINQLHFQVTIEGESNE